MIFESGVVSARRTGMPCGPLANPPTSVCATLKPQTLSPPPMWPPFCQVTRPSSNEDGLYAAGLRFGDQRVMAILAALVGFCHVVGGFTNGQLVERAAA